MEKDIEILEKYIKDKAIKTMGGLVTPDKEELQAIENLINRVKELEHQNNILKEKNQDYKYNFNTMVERKEKAMKRVKELEEELDRQINAREIEEKYVEENFITRAEFKEGLDKQNELLKKYYIPKSKIKEKIEELEKLEKGFNFTGLITECETKIEVLQELLEEEDK